MIGINSTPAEDLASNIVPVTIEEQVVESYKDHPVLQKIAWCESRFRQFEKDGVTPFRGIKNPQDVGVMQINERYHLEDSKELGINIYTLEGNLKYAKHIFDKQGTKPWRASEPCWGKTHDPVVASK